ncbi:MAG: hypothetical protein LWY06_08120 [Firmicutes bacterium]|nr:hypothetical protein [Bacillota bacterium]
MSDSLTDKLIDLKEPFVFSNERDIMFLEAMQESFNHHYNNCPVYQTICRLEGFSPEHFQSYNDIFYIPHIFVSVTDTGKLLSVPENEVKTIRKSSDAPGGAGAVCFDSITLNRIRKIIFNIYQDFDMAKHSVKSNCILFSCKEKLTGEGANPLSDIYLNSLANINELVYALKWNTSANAYEPDFDSVSEALARFAEADAPLLIIGFPALISEIRTGYPVENPSPFAFGKDSYLITGGGWSTKTGENIDKGEFRKTISQWLGIPQKNIREIYGMEEHGVPYCECECGKMHIPVYSRVVVRDPETMRILPDNIPGLFHFYTPYVNSFPALSLLTTDTGIVSDNCECGRNSPYIEVVGRAGIARQRGSAVKALDFLPDGKNNE